LERSPVEDKLEFSKIKKVEIETPKVVELTREDPVETQTKVPCQTEKIPQEVVVEKEEPKLVKEAEASLVEIKKPEEL